MLLRVPDNQTRLKILEAAERLMWRYGFKKTTIDEIAQEAEVGKGTVYLYFSSKEEIALALIAGFKAQTLERAEAVVQDAALSPVAKLKEILTLPMVCAHERYQQSPAVLDMVVAVRPHIQAHLKPYIEQELALIAQVLEEGNRTGTFLVRDSRQAAQTLKFMCYGFLPPTPCVSGTDAIRTEIGHMVDLAVRGLAAPGHRDEE